jgi:hypothetical protein
VVDDYTIVLPDQVPAIADDGLILRRVRALDQYSPLSDFDFWRL